MHSTSLSFIISAIVSVSSLRKRIELTAFGIPYIKLLQKAFICGIVLCSIEYFGVVPLYSGKLNFKIGVSISYLSEFMQRYLLNEIIPLGIKIKNSHISELKDLDECQCEDTAEIKQVFFKPESNTLSTITISGTKLNEYSDIIKDTKEIEKLFFEFLDLYRKNQVQQVH